MLHLLHLKTCDRFFAVSLHTNVSCLSQEPHRHKGVFVVRGGKEDLLATANLTPGESVYNEKRVSIENGKAEDGTTTKTEYRVWNPFRSKLAAGILGGLETIYIKPGSKALYLGAASGTSVSHVADIVGPTGTVYAVEFSHRSGRDLINMATRRTNVVPIVEDARMPLKYRMLVDMVDFIFAEYVPALSNLLMTKNQQTNCNIVSLNPIKPELLPSMLSSSSSKVVACLSPSRQTALIQLLPPSRCLLQRSRNCGRRSSSPRSSLLLSLTREITLYVFLPLCVTCDESLLLTSL